MDHIFRDYMAKVTVHMLNKHGRDAENKEDPFRNQENRNIIPSITIFIVLKFCYYFVYLILILCSRLSVLILIPDTFIFNPQFLIIFYFTLVLNLLYINMYVSKIYLFYNMLFLNSNILFIYKMLLLKSFINNILLPLLIIIIFTFYIILKSFIYNHQLLKSFIDDILLVKPFTVNLLYLKSFISNRLLLKIFKYYPLFHLKSFISNPRFHL